MELTKAGRGIGVSLNDSPERIHQRAELHFSGLGGYKAAVVVVTIAFVDCYILFDTEDDALYALSVAPDGFERGPGTTIFAEVLVDREAWL